MKVFGFILVTMFLSTSFTPYLAAQDRAGQRGRLLKMWLEKKGSAKKIETIVVGVTKKSDIPYLNDNNPYTNWIFIFLLNKISHLQF